MKKPIPSLTLCGLVLVGVVLAAEGCRTSGGPSVKVFTVETGDVRETVSINGVLIPTKFAQVEAPGEGKLISYEAVEGQAVKAGQVLLQLDTADALAALHQAEAAQVSARADLERFDRDQSSSLADATLQAASVAERLAAAEENLQAVVLRLSQNLATDLDVEQAEQDVRLAEIEVKRTAQTLLKVQDQGNQLERAVLSAKLQVADDGVQSARRRLQNTAVVAPVDGTVVGVSEKLKSWAGNHSPIAQGLTVHNGEQLMEIAQTGNLMLEAKVDEVKAARIRVGQNVVVTLDAVPDTEYTGRVASVSVKAVKGTDSYPTVQIDVEIDGNDSQLKVGLSARAEVVLANKIGVLRIPLEAVRKKDGRTSVFVVANATAIERPVTLGTAGELYLEVLSGLHEGESVIVSDLETIKTGMRVTTSGSR